MGEGAMRKEKGKKTESRPSAEYYESRRDFLIKLAEARREKQVPIKKEKNPLTLCPVK